MKKAKFLPLIIVLAFFPVSCDFFDLFEDELATLKEGEFYAQNLKTGKYYKVDAERLAEGNDCVVWAENGSGVTKATAEAVADEYDYVIRRRIVDAFGKKNFYVNASGNEVNANFQGAKRPFNDILDYANWLAGRNDGKLTILLLDIKDTYDKDKNLSFVAGYFASVNFLAGKNKIGDTTHYGNGRDMIYIDTDPGLQKNPESTYATFAHELQHLINFVTTVLLNRSSTMDTWIDEGLSTWAEYLYGGNDVDRCDWFINDEAGTIAKGNNFFVWGNHTENPRSILDEYATVYLFFRWLSLHAAAQTPPQNNIYYQIITSPHYDYRAVTDVAKGIKTEWKDWDKLLGAWLAANYNPKNNNYGYKGDDYLMNNIKVYPLTVSSILLYSGEGVYSNLDNSFFTPDSGGTGTNVRYAGLRSDVTSTVSISGHSQSYTGNTLLTFNAGTNTKPNGPERGQLTGRSSVLPRSLTGETKTVEFKGPYVIDARDVLGRNRDKDPFPLPPLLGRTGR
jgi:hypothetical protein